jgi:hypothetical protein
MVVIAEQRPHWRAFRVLPTGHKRRKNRVNHFRAFTSLKYPKYPQDGQKAVSVVGAIKSPTSSVIPAITNMIWLI